MSAAIRTIIRRIGAGDGFDDITNYPDATIDLWIADALIDVPTSQLGTKADRSVAYYTCHLMLQSTSNVSSTGGSIKREKTRNVEVEYFAGGNTSTSGTTDKYYDMYIRLIRKCTRMSPFILNGRTP